MGSGFAWSLAEDEELCRLVRAYGCHWTRIASSGFLPWRSAHALRGRWASLRSSPPEVELGAPARLPLLSGLSVSGVAFTLAFNRGRDLSRCASAGRPWDFIVRHSRGVDGTGSAAFSLLHRLSSPVSNRLSCHWTHGTLPPGRPQNRRLHRPLPSLWLLALALRGRRYGVPSYQLTSQFITSHIVHDQLLLVLGKILSVKLIVVGKPYCC